MGRLAVSGVLLRAAVLVVLTTACPHEWAKGGAIDAAMEKDIEESLPGPPKKCPNGKEPEWVCKEDKCGWACE